MGNNLIFGKDGEEMAAAFMIEKGFEVLSKNYRSGRAEIDLIVKKDSLLVFAEVKLRSKVGKFGLPEDAVNSKKEELIVGAAENYILDNDWKGEVRFDIISIIYNKEIHHIEDAFG